MRQMKSLVLDLLLIASATLLALYLRDNLEVSADSVELVLPYLSFSLIAGLIVLPATGVSRTMWRFAGVAEYGRLALSCFLIVIIALAMSFAFNRLDNVLRSVPVAQLLLMTMMLSGLRLASRTHRFRHERRPEVVESAPAGEAVLVVGLNTVAELFLQAVAEHGRGRVQIAGVIGRSDRHTGQLFRSHKVLGVPESIDSVIRELEVHGIHVGRVVVTVAFDQLPESAQKALLDLENGTHIEVDYFAERLGFADHRAMSSIARDQLQSTAPAPIGATDARKLAEDLQRPYWKIKRGIDVVLGMVLIVLTLPLLLLVGVLTALSVGSPVVFWQQRPGLYGRPFKVFKFRTMLGAHDAEGRRLPDEARQTYLGHLLRITRLDELPQLFNIVTGNMSFVGPRPLLDVDQLTSFRDRLWVRPGLTGWAQVNGGKSVSATDKMALDMWYIRNASFALDCRIMLLTVRMVFRGERTNPLAVEQAWMELSRRP
jgi:lipopolysaccharide/colanic/teichoic acid biosynthesis glycosyltransferase